MLHPEFNILDASRQGTLTPGPSPKKGKGERSLIRGFCTAFAVQNPRISVFSPSSVSGEGAGGWGCLTRNQNRETAFKIIQDCPVEKQPF